MRATSSSPTHWLFLAALGVALGQERVALAQSASAETAPAPADASGAAPAAATTTTTTTYTAPYGVPAPGTDINAGLPSSSRPITGGQSDGFDLNQPSGGGGTVYGGKGSEGVLLSGRSVSVPEIHTVKRGDTLWDLCDRYFGNPYAWPKVWSYNPQLQNPHWIYPGDEVRMRQAGARSTLSSLHERGLTRGGSGSGDGVGAGTVFLRNEGYIDDPEKDRWGELVGSREDQMLLSEGNRVYLRMRSGVKVAPGQSLTIFLPGQKPKDVPGARQPPGEIVAVKGTVRIDQYDPDSHLARGIITESLDVIERGALVGPVGRRFDVVPPKVNDKTVWARVLTGIYPHVFVAREQIVFIDRGSEDGLVPGNRLFIVRRGDAWKRGLKTATRATRQRMLLDSPDDSPVELTPVDEDQKAYPEEVVGELRVVRTRKYSSLCMVTASQVEISPGDRAVAKKGY